MSLSMSRTEGQSKKSSESAVLTSLLRNTTKQGLIYLVSVVVTAAVGFGILPIYARIFTTAEYGLLSLATLLISLGSIVIGSWLASCITRFLPYYQRIKETNTFYSSVMFSMILALAALLLLSVPAYFLLRGFFDIEFQPLILPVATSIALTMLFQILLTIFRVKQEAKRYVVFQLASTCLALIIGLSLTIFLDMGVSGILWGKAMILLILGAISFKMLFLTDSNVKRSAISLPAVKEFALYGFPAAASTIGTWILDGADRYIIGFFRGTAEVGLYSMAYAIGNSIILLVGAFMLTATPTLMLTYESDNREITSRLLSQLTRIFLLIGLPAAVGISVLADPVIRLLTTEPYYSAFIIVPFVALGGFIYGLCLLSYTGLQIAKKSHIMARNWFAAGAFNILLNIIFVPKFGYIAAAVTTLVSYVALLILNIKSSSKYLRWAIIPRSAVNTTVASIVMGGVLFLIIYFSASAVVACILGVIAGIVIYFGMLFLLKEFSQGEVLQVRRFFKGKLPWARHS